MSKAEALQDIERKIADLARYVQKTQSCAIDLHLAILFVTAWVIGFAELAVELDALRIHAANLRASDLAGELLALSNPGGRRYAEAVMTERVPDGPRFETLGELIQSLKVKS